MKIVALAQCASSAAEGEKIALRRAGRAELEREVDRGEDGGNGGHVFCELWSVG